MDHDPPPVLSAAAEACRSCFTMGRPSRATRSTTGARRSPLAGVGEHVAGDDGDALAVAALSIARCGNRDRRAAFRGPRPSARENARPARRRRCRSRRRCRARAVGCSRSSGWPAPGDSRPRQSMAAVNSSANLRCLHRLVPVGDVLPAGKIRRPVGAQDLQRSTAIGRSVSFGKYGPRNHSDDATRCSRALA